MSNELAPDSRQSVDLKWKLRKALEKNVAPSDDGKGLDFGQDITVDGKLHLNELSDIVGPDGSALFTDATQINLSDKVSAMLTHYYDGRYSGATITFDYVEEEGKLFNQALLDAGATSFFSMFNGANFLEASVFNIHDLPASGCDFSAMFAHAKGERPLTLGNGGGNGRAMFDESNFTSITVRSGSAFKVTGNCTLAFNHCEKLTELGAIDFSEASNLRLAFQGCSALTRIAGTGFSVSFDVSETALEHDALVVLINNLATVTTAKMLTMGETKLALLSDEEKLGATNKGWSLA